MTHLLRALGRERVLVALQALTLTIGVVLLVWGRGISIPGSILLVVSLAFLWVNIALRRRSG